MAGIDSDAFELKRMMRQDAHEKAFEIQVQSQRNFEEERDRIIKRGIEDLNQEYDKKLTVEGMNQNIEKSKKINDSRLLTIKARNSCIEKVKDVAQNKILNEYGPDNKVYQETLKNLII
mmetsp:Transcript_13792/g.9759  ORF Transcript_13792/g.9759 Transcript_13792/m.9759 type:complete len:119 (-) Transcript_13792:488-844(-)|eukprot:CAMPEP_0116876724 /NCGR_PEP_ID=MMETSP0463-20121206/8603_1 /TAXON_ID=181622 /ORGANISM="Strombidinopsis sp, Strain SopsisLIS2011" /LENGTH=118 /DNA_ID=CAMNT_0004523489 /DNA_START=23 /DNA_END=379 /DNA_ORIENTATION=+